MSEEYTCLKELVEHVQDEIQRGLRVGWHVKNDGIKIELAVVKTKRIGGKLQFILAEAGGRYQKGELSKISFSISNEETVYSV